MFSCKSLALVCLVKSIDLMIIIIKSIVKSSVYEVNDRHEHLYVYDASTLNFSKFLL